MTYLRLIFISTPLILCGCALSQPTLVARPHSVSGIHQLEILVIADDDTLKTGVPDPDYAAAPDIAAIVRMHWSHDKAVQSAADALKPLLAELTYANTKEQLVACLRDALVSRGIKIVSITRRGYDGNGQSEVKIEEAAASSSRDADLLAINPTLAMSSSDDRSFLVSLIARIYRRNSSGIAAEAAFQESSITLTGDDPVRQWSADNGAEFLRQFTMACHQVSEEAAGMLAP